MGRALTEMGTRQRYSAQIPAKGAKSGNVVVRGSYQGLELDQFWLG
jgi:hypothetical protein